MNRPVAFGLNVDPSAGDPAASARIAAIADESGLEYAGVQDHAYNPGFTDTLSHITWLAARTSRVHLFTNVASLPLRPPAMLAKQAATIDLLSGGRFELGGPRRTAPSPVIVPSPGRRPRQLHYFGHEKLAWNPAREIRYSSRAGARRLSAVLLCVGDLVCVTTWPQCRQAGLACSGWPQSCRIWTAGWSTAHLSPHSRSATITGNRSYPASVRWYSKRGGCSLYCRRSTSPAAFGYADTPMTAGLDVGKADPRDVVAAIYDGLEAGDQEALADDTSRWVKQQLSEPLTALYPQLAGAR